MLKQRNLHCVLKNDIIFLYLNLKDIKNKVRTMAPKSWKSCEMLRENTKCRISHLIH